MDKTTVFSPDKIVNNPLLRGESLENDWTLEGAIGSKVHVHFQHYVFQKHFIIDRFNKSSKKYMIQTWIKCSISKICLG